MDEDYHVYQCVGISGALCVLIGMCRETCSLICF